MKALLRRALLENMNFAVVSGLA